MQKATQIIIDIKKDTKNLEFLPTGFEEVDNFLDGGFMRKELVVLGAFTGGGKSYIAGQILWNLAQTGFHGAYFSLEISNRMILSRIVGGEASIKPARLIAGFLTPLEQQERIKAEAKLIAHEGLMDFYDELYDLPLIEKAIREKVNTTEHYDFVIIDFIQNVLTTDRDEYERMSRVAITLQKLAKETNCCILVLSQLSNSANKDPNALEYKGSGSIAMVCDLGFFLRRSETTNGMLLNLKKNRRGFSGKDFSLKFNDPGGKITQ